MVPYVERSERSAGERHRDDGDHGHRVHAVLHRQHQRDLGCLGGVEAVPQVGLWAQGGPTGSHFAPGTGGVEQAEPLLHADRVCGDRAAARGSHGRRLVGALQGSADAVGWSHRDLASASGPNLPGQAPHRVPRRLHLRGP